MSCDFFLESDKSNTGCGDANPHSVFSISIDFDKEEKRAAKEERFEDAAKFRDRIMPIITFDIFNGWQLTYDE